jgi:glycosyltransferase involved in cell wall biosynthesis
MRMLEIGIRRQAGRRYATTGRAPGPRTIVFVQPTSEVGGSDIALYRLAARLDRRRFAPVVVLPREGPLSDKLREARIRVAVHPMAQLRSTRNPLTHVRYLATFAPSVIGLALLIRRERASLVHSNSLYSLQGAWAARLAGVPHVWHIREIPDAPAPIRSLLTIMARHLSTRIVAMTAAVASMFGGRGDDRLVVIPEGIDLTTFTPAHGGERIRHELGIPPEAPVAGFVARLDPWKGADVFLRAAAGVLREIPRAHFIVCGGELPGYEAYAASLRDIATRLGLRARTHFTGWTYCVDDIPDVMGAVDVLVHTSVRPEPFGLVLIEAMASGKPVVAADDGGVPEIVSDGATGYLTTPDDPDAAAKAIASLLRDPVRARAMGTAGRARAERLFDIRGYVRRVEHLYDEVTGTRAATERRAA